MLSLPRELTIYTVGELRDQLQSSLAADGAAAPGGTCELEGGSVDAVDAAGLQLLVACGNALRDEGRRIEVVNASEPLASACNLLGLSSLLQADAAAKGTP
jgi:ABC-type transporter Mla MlaB component